MEIKLKPTEQASRGVLILAAQCEGIELTNDFIHGYRLTKPSLKLEEELVVPIPCQNKDCTRKLKLKADGETVVQCAGYQKYAGETAWGSGCDYQTYPDYEPAACPEDNRAPTQQIAERIAFMAGYEAEEI